MYCGYRMARGQPAAHGTAGHRLAQLMMQHPLAQPAASVVSRGAAALGALPACSRRSSKGAVAVTRQAGVFAEWRAHAGSFGLLRLCDDR